MISIATLNELQDGDLRTTIEQAEGILKQRDTDRKAKAIEDARATLAAARTRLRHFKFEAFLWRLPEL
jgi:hypothetical protein